MTATFAPTRNPSFPYDVELTDRIDVTQFGKGYVQTRPHGLRPLRRVRLRWNVLTKDERDYIEDFAYRNRAEAFYWEPLDEEFSPLATTATLSQTSGGSLLARTYSVKYAYYDNTSGEVTKPSSAATLAISANNLVKVTVPVFPPSADRVRIYAVETPGTETLQDTVTTRTWTEPTGGLISGSALPTTNTLKVALIWRFVESPRFQKFKANRYSCETRLQELVVA